MDEQPPVCPYLFLCLLISVVLIHRLMLGRWQACCQESMLGQRLVPVQVQQPELRPALVQQLVLLLQLVQRVCGRRR